MDEIIETPDIFTPIHQEELIQNGELVPFSEELSRKIGLNFNWLIDAKPIGSIIFVNTEQSSVEAINLIPSTSAWQECNGGEITHPNSPLRSIGEQRNYTPNPAGRYIRVSSDLTNSHTGGSQTHQLQHTHTVGVNPDPGAATIQDKGDRNYRVPHTHAMSTQFPESFELDSPAFIYLRAFMKIV